MYTKNFISEHIKKHKLKLYKIYNASTSFMNVLTFFPSSKRVEPDRGRASKLPSNSILSFCLLCSAIVAPADRGSAILLRLLNGLDRDDLNLKIFGLSVGSVVVVLGCVLSVGEDVELCVVAVVSEVDVEAVVLFDVVVNVVVLVDVVVVLPISILFLLEYIRAPPDEDWFRRLNNRITFGRLALLSSAGSCSSSISLFSSSSSSSSSKTSADLVNAPDCSSEVPM